MNQAEERGRSLGATMAGAAKTVAAAGAAIGAVAVGIGAAATRIGGQWQEAGNAIRAQTGQTVEDVTSTKNAVRDLALETGRFRADEMISGLYGVSRAGQTTEFQMMLVEQATRLADSSGKGFAGSIANLDALMVKFSNDTLDGAIKFTNMLATAQGEAGVANDSFVEGLKRAAPTINAAGLDYDFAAAALTRYYQATGSMATAATGLERIFSDMLDPTSNIREAMDDLGVAVVRNADGSLNAQESLNGLMRSLHSLSPAAQEAALSQINFSGSAAAMFNVLKNETQYVDALAESFRYGMEAGEDYFRVMEAIEARTGGLVNQFGIFRIAGQDMLKTIFEIIEAPLAEVIGNAANSVRDLAWRMREGDLRPHVERLGVAIGQIAQTVSNFITTATPLIVTLLPAAANVLTTVLNVVTPLTPAILAGAAAWGIWKAGAAITPVMRAGQTAIRGFTSTLITKKAALAAATAATTANATAEAARAKAVEIGRQADVWAEKATAARIKAKGAYKAALAAGMTKEQASAAAKLASANADKYATVASNSRKKATALQTKASTAQAAADTAQAAATGKVTIATKAKTAAVTLLNKAWKANPVGIVVAGFAAIAAGVVVLARRMNEANSAQRETAQRMAEMRDEARRTAEAVEASANAHHDRVQAMRDEAQVANSLIDSLENARRADNGSAESRARVLFYTNQLVDVMPHLNDYIDEETGLLSLNTTELRDNTAARMDRALAAAAEAEVTRLRLDEIRIMRELEAAIRDNEIAQRHHEAALESANESLSRYGIVAGRVAAHFGAGELLVRNWGSAASDAQARVEYLTASLGLTQDEIVALTDFLDEHNVEQIKASDAITATGDALTQAGQSAQQAIPSFDELRDATRLLDRAIREQTDAGHLSYETITDLIEAGHDLTEITRIENGIIKLNTEAFIANTVAKYESYIATLEASQNTAMVEALRIESEVAIMCAESYIALAGARAIADGSDTEIANINARIAAMRSQIATLGQVETATRGAGNAARDRERAERDAYNERREIFRSELRMIEQRRRYAGMSINDEISLLADLRKAYADNAEKIYEIDRAKLGARQRIMDAQKDTLRRMEEAENRFAEAVENRAQVIINSALQAGNINRLIADSTEARVNAVIAAEERLADTQQRLADIRANTERDTFNRNNRVLDAEERLASAQLALAEAYGEDRIRAERRVNEALHALNEARVAAANDTANRQKEIARLQNDIVEQQAALVKAREEAEKSQAQLIAESLREQIDNMKEHARMMEHLLGETDISKEFLAEMRLLEVGAIDELRTLYESSEEELAKIADLFGEMQALATKQATHEMQGFREEINEEIQALYSDLNNLIYAESPDVGENFVQGIINGVKAKSAELGYTVRDTARNSMINAAKTELDESSPSQEGVEIGVNFVQGKINGIVRMSNPLSRTVMDMLRRTVREADRFLVPSAFNLGRSFMRELGQGLIAEEAALLAAARHIAASIRAAFATPGGNPPAAAIAAAHQAAAFFQPIGFSAPAPAQAYMPQSTAQGGITQIIHVHGNVTEEEFGYQAFRGVQKAQFAAGGM